MNITVIAPGKLKEAYLRDAVEEYRKRISAYAKLEIVELTPEKLPDDPSASQIEAALEKEAVAILRKIPRGSYTVALCIEGRQLSSEALAEKISQVSLSGKSSVTFIIGSSYGLHDSVKNSCSERLSFSKMTFPHQLMRVMLLEQTYRAFQIINNGKYHK